MDHKEAFRKLETAAQDERNNGAQHALISAYDNAATTVYEEKAAPECDLWHIAMNSICYTSSFDDSADVRAWFEAQGYRW